MKFRSREEFKEAMIATVLYLPEMIRLYEAGLQLLGARVLKKYVYRSKDRGVDPAYLIEGAGKKFYVERCSYVECFFSLDVKSIER